MHSRRARPTLRVIFDDLADEWTNPVVRRAVAQRDGHKLGTLGDLAHPIVSKAGASVGEDPTADNHEGKIASVKSHVLLEIRVGQWRGAVWRDPEDDSHWLVSVGLAKGGHADHDDFYQRLSRLESANLISTLLPTAEDRALLRKETAARMFLEWELGVQRSIADELHAIIEGGTGRIQVSHPVTSEVLSVIRLELDCAADSHDIIVTFETARKHKGGSLEWALIGRVLAALDPPAERWDRYADTFSNMAEPGSWSLRAETLNRLSERGELAEFERGARKHYVHHPHLMQHAVEGSAVRALCGVFFVPMQDPDAKPMCVVCEERIPSE